jgi:hypothetical protein
MRKRKIVYILLDQHNCSWILRGLRGDLAMSRDPHLLHDDSIAAVSEGLTYIYFTRAADYKIRTRATSERPCDFVKS